MKNSHAVYPALLLLAASGGLQANVQVEFVESAPKDWFAIKNIGSCELTELVVSIDLRPSVGQLIFDTTGSGAGVQVFQPFEVKQGVISLLSSDRVQDGDQQLTVEIPSLAPGSSASFTIDVDDTVPSGAMGVTMIAGAEIEGATVSLQTGNGEDVDAAFNAGSQAVVELADC